MGDQALLQRVQQRGLCIDGEVVPLAFFRHGQPGRRFVVCRAEGGWRIHVRTADKEAIRNMYRLFAATSPTRQSRRRLNRAGKQVVTAGPSAGILDPLNLQVTALSKDHDTLKNEERRELDRVNELAMQLVEMKTRLMNMNTGRRAFVNQELVRIQELHERHLDRCMRLRSLLSCLSRGPGEGFGASASFARTVRSAS